MINSRQRKKKGFSFGMMICLFITQVYSQDCSTNHFTPDNSNPELAYRQRANDKRCEGLITKLVSGTRSFTIVSVMIGKLAYELTADEILKIKAPSTKRFKLFAVTGTSFNHPKNYRLDMSLPAGAQKDIPLKEVIAENEFNPDQLGFYINSLNEEEDYYSPVSTTSKYYKTVIQDSILTVSLICGINVKNIVASYSVIDKDGICGSVLATIGMNGLFLKAKEISLKINLNTIPGIKNYDVDLCYVVNAKDAATNDDLPAYQFKVFVPKWK